MQCVFVFHIHLYNVYAFERARACVLTFSCVDVKPLSDFASCDGNCFTRGSCVLCIVCDLSAVCCN